ncbi:hypothetical protein LLG95_03860 [bacterium]|nr:hypothetical protein [bacterium]
MNRIFPCLALFALCGSITFAASKPPAVPLGRQQRGAVSLKTPTPVPTPAKSPIPTPVRTVRPLPLPTMQATPRATATPEPQPPNVTISLDRVSLLRSRYYTANPAEKPAVWTPRMLLEFRIDIPKGWLLMSVDDGTLKSVTDRRGRALMPKAPVNAEAATSGQAIALEVKPDHAVVEFTSELPSREDDRLGGINASFALTLGIPQPIHIDNLRQKKTATSLLPSDQYPDVILALDHVGNDSISIAVIGDTTRFGGFTFKGPNGETLEPITSERTSAPAEKGKAPGSLWRYSFIELPGKISMDVQYYPLRRRAIYNYDRPNIPLP